MGDLARAVAARRDDVCGKKFHLSLRKAGVTGHVRRSLRCSRSGMGVAKIRLCFSMPYLLLAFAIDGAARFYLPLIRTGLIDRMRSVLRDTTTAVKVELLRLDIARARLFRDRISAIEDALELGRLIGDQGNLAGASELFQNAAADAERIDNSFLTARSRQLMAAVSIRRHEFEAARNLLLTAIPILRNEEDQGYALDALLRLALAQRKLGDDSAAGIAFKEATEIALRTGDTERAIWALGDAGGMAYDSGDYLRVEPYFAEALELATRARKIVDQAKYMYFLGVVRYRLNRADSAQSLLRNSEKIYSRLGIHDLARRAARDLALIESPRRA